MPKKGLAAEFRRRRIASGVQLLGDKTVATITLARVATMTAEGRKHVSEWLRGQATFIETNGEQLAPKYRARYLAR